MGLLRSFQGTAGTNGNGLAKIFCATLGINGLTKGPFREMQGITVLVYAFSK